MVTLKFTEIHDRYYPTSDARLKISISKEAPYYCTYRPELDYNYDNLAADISAPANSIIKYDTSGVSHYVMPSTPSPNLVFNHYAIAMRSNMRIPTLAELYFLLQSGQSGLTNCMGKSAECYEITSSAASNTWLGFRWQFTDAGTVDMSASDCVKGFEPKTNGQNSRRYAVTTIH
jgi:hypothetical protein